MQDTSATAPENGTTRDGDLARRVTQLERLVRKLVEAELTEPSSEVRKVIVGELEAVADNLPVVGVFHDEVRERQGEAPWRAACCCHWYAEYHHWSPEPAEAQALAHARAEHPLFVRDYPDLVVKVWPRLDVA